MNLCFHAIKESSVTMEVSMGILAKLLGSRGGPVEVDRISPSGVLKDENGWYYEELQDYSSSQNTLRIDQDRPGDWYVHRSFCEVADLNDPERTEDVRRFFAGSYRWLELERDRSVPRTRNIIKVIGTFRDAKGREQRVHLGFLDSDLAADLARHDVGKLWGRIRFIKFPSPGRRPSYLVRFDLMVQLEDGTFD
jgi:hypothetical protein